MDRYNELTSFQKILYYILLILGCFLLIWGLLVIIVGISIEKITPNTALIGISLIPCGIIVLAFNEIYLAILKIDINNRRRDESK